MEELHCRDAGSDCDAVVNGESVDEVMAQVGRHTREVHRVEVAPDVEEPIARLVRDT